MIPLTVIGKCFSFNNMMVGMVMMRMTMMRMMMIMMMVMMMTLGGGGTLVFRGVHTLFIKI